MSDNLNSTKVVVFGTGEMGQEYVKILNDLGVLFSVVGNSEEGCERFYKETGIHAIPRGVEGWKDNSEADEDYAIIAVNVEGLSGMALSMMDSGIRNILIEKPGGLNLAQIKQVNDRANNSGSNVYVAYNRRFYASVLKAREIIIQDGGVKNFVFEFTEWPHLIPEKITENVKQKWFLANSSHVADTAFFLGGTPTEITSYVAGSCDWHPAATIFSGAGITENGSLFSYHANWLAPGRWGVEVITDCHRLIFKPLEELQIQNNGELSLHNVELDDSLDRKYKPGLYHQVYNFLSNNTKDFCTIQDQTSMIDVYCRMAAYR